MEAIDETLPMTAKVYPAESVNADGSALYQGKSPRWLALERCEELMSWYETHASNQRRLTYIMHSMAIIFAGITPVLVVIQQAVGENIPARVMLSVLIALFPAIAAIITALDGAHKWRENWTRFSQALAELQSEKTKYLTRSGRYYDRDLSDESALANFVKRVEMISLQETVGWRTSFEQREKLETLVDYGKKNGSQQEA